jgi:hypothetical protein
MILSASRRCDLPAFAMAAFMADVSQGYRLVASPFDARARRRVSLLPEDVDCIVFWTRNPLPLLPHIEELETRGLTFYVQVSLTGYPRALEPGVLGRKEALEAIAALSSRIGPRRVLWRYDPVFVARGLEASWQEENFSRLAEELGGLVSRVTLSLLDEYRFTAARLARAGFPDPVFGSLAGKRGGSRATAGPELFPVLPPEPYPALLSGFAREASARKLEILACAEPYELSGLGIGKATCIDLGLAESLAGHPIQAARDRGQRPGCGCASSVDLGSYGPCPAGCVYCYARRG